MADVRHHITFARMNPVTVGHEAVVNQVVNSAKKEKAGHTIILSSSQDAKKNPLHPDQKLKHARRAFPGANVQLADKDSPTILHHASNLHKQGVTHLTLHVGSDRVKSMSDLLHRYNGQPGAHGNYNFKKITVKPVGGERKENGGGVEAASGTAMRKHAAANNRAEFHKMAPSAMSPAQKDEMMKDVRHGMKANESVLKRFVNWLTEGAPTNAATPSVRGLGNKSGSADGESSSYVIGNIADSDNRNNIMGLQKSVHHNMHATWTMATKGKK